jgi:thymidylate synthase (FAD)
MSRNTELISITPYAEFKLVEMARVSAPANTTGPWQTTKREAQSRRLLKYLIDHKHWSPFEMCHMTVKIVTTRDISRQILRHRSFSFQEFSQRYQDIKALSNDPIFREARLQDKKNRQNSIPLLFVDDNKVNEKNQEISEAWYKLQQSIWDVSIDAYNNALELGIAKEQARVLLPEGLTQTQMYMSGSIRSWIHYLQIRTGVETQKEHRDIAKEIKKIFELQMPIIYDALFADESANKESSNKVVDSSQSITIDRQTNARQE